jgi:hypothetical protein
LGHTLSLFVGICCGKTPISRQKKRLGGPLNERTEFFVFGFGTQCRERAKPLDMPPLET